MADNYGTDYDDNALFSGGSLLRFTLLFGSMAVALALLVTPMLNDNFQRVADRSGAGVDTMATGSVRNTNRYVVHRSVLQSSPDAVCIIHETGAKSGDC